MKIFLPLLLALTFIGCSGDSQELQNITPKLIVGTTLSGTTLKDQFGTPHTIKQETTKLIFAFSKDAAHTCNDFFATQTPTYLADHHSAFIADVSAAPSLIRSMFIMPGLKDFKHKVLLLDDKKQAAPYRAKVDTDKMLLVILKDGKIVATSPLANTAALKAAIEK